MAQHPVLRDQGGRGHLRHHEAGIHAAVLREEGRQRLYRLNGNALKPIHDWVRNYERSWSQRFEQLDSVLEELKQNEEEEENGDRNG